MAPSSSRSSRESPSAFLRYSATGTVLDPALLLEEYEACAARLEELIARINRTNSETRTEQGTITHSVKDMQLHLGRQELQDFFARNAVALLVQGRTENGDPDIVLNEAVYHSEMATTSRNRAISYLLESKGVLRCGVDEAQPPTLSMTHTPTWFLSALLSSGM